MALKPVLVGRPACDWLTLTSFEEQEERALLECFWNMSRVYRANPESAKQAQYRGVSFDGAFIGLTEIVKDEQSKRHVMYRSWGCVAQDSLVELCESPIRRCRRIDLQITVPQPFSYRARNLKDELEGAEWFGRKRKSLLYENSGLDTVYVGSRASDRVIRVYVKEIDGLRWLRFEVEYREDRANPVYFKCSEGNQQTIGGILRSEIEQLPEVADVGILAIKEALYHAAVTVSPPERIEQPGGKLSWLKGSVDPVVLRMINDHDDGEAVKNLVKRWYKAVQDLDNMAEFVKVASNLSQFNP